VKAARSSPLKGRKSKGDIKQTKQAPGWYLRSRLTEGNLELIEITNGSYTTDAYFQQLIETLSSDEHDPVKDIGLMGAYYMRISLQRDEALLNAKNGYQRKAFLRILDEDETAPEKRFEALTVIKTFLEKPENNQYGTNVYIPKLWDLTPSEPQPLPKLDHVLQYKEIIRIVRDLFDNVDSNWAVNNMESAELFFTEGYVPFQAHNDLGFPMEKVKLLN
jgi:hypothetical protein